MAIITGMKTRASAVIDGILIFISFFAFSFIAVSYFTRNLLANLAVSISIAFFVLYLIKLRGSKKASDTDNEQKLLTQLSCYGEAYAKGIILSALKKRYTVTEEKDNVLINEKTVLISFSLTPLTEEIIPALFLKSNSVKGVVLFTGAGLNKRANELLNMLPIKVKVLKINDVYALLKSLDALPEITLNLKKQKHGFKRFLAEALKRERAKNFFILALFLSATAFFSSISIFFLCLAGINLVLGILSSGNVGDKLLKTKNSSGQN